MERIELECLLVALACLAAGCAPREAELPVESLVEELVACSVPMARLRERNESGPPASPRDVVASFEAELEALYPSVAENCASARRALLAKDREAISAIVRRLEALALDTCEGRSAGEFLTCWLGEAFCGGSSWRISSWFPADVPERNRDRRLAWTALLERVRNDEAFWRLPRDERGRWCAENDGTLVHAETVMRPGTHIRAVTKEGIIEITADEGFGRSYSWNGATRSAVLEPREERWYGSLGIYSPGTGDPWKEHEGLTRGVVDEGQLHFETVEQAVGWLGLRTYMDFAHRNDGLVVGWTRTPERRQLTVEVWQIYVDGAKPAELPESEDGSIEVDGQLVGS